MYNLEKIFKGVVSVKEEDGVIEPQRFTDKQLETYKNINEETTFKRAKSLAGVMMEFVTEARKISFDFEVCEYCREWTGFDVYENDVLKSVDTREGINSNGSFLYELEEQGKVKITIYFMFSANLKLKNLDLGEVEYVTEEKINYLALGDSITQGMHNKSASMSYPSILGRIYNLNVLNHGVGGYWFDKKSLDPELPFNPDIITVAYGANDIMMSYRNGNDAEYVGKKAEEYLNELISIYPDAHVKLITPIWLGVERENEAVKIHASLIREELTRVASELSVDVIDGEKLVPHDSFYYSDSPQVHPNDTGFLHYALNLNIK